MMSGLLIQLGLVLCGRLAAAQAPGPALEPTLLFNLTISPQDGFPSFSTGEWDSLNLTSGWAARTLAGDRSGEGQMWMNGPFCTAVSMEGEYTGPQTGESGPAPVRLVLDTTATVNAPMGGGDVHLATEGDWHYCAPRIDVSGVDFVLHNLTITTGMVAAA